MNIMDFVDSLKLQLSDLENLGKLGYVDGISKIIVQNLKSLDAKEKLSAEVMEEIELILSNKPVHPDH
jgi:hypothetical protein